MSRKNPLEAFNIITGRTKANRSRHS
jgi:hypothetical protein